MKICRYLLKIFLHRTFYNIMAEEGYKSSKEIEINITDMKYYQRSKLYLFINFYYFN